MHSPKCFSGPVGCILLLSLSAAVLSCKLFTTPTTKEVSVSDVKAFEDQRFRLFLAQGSEQGTYEFVTCDAQSVERADTQECTLEGSCSQQISRKPSYCVSAFRSLPREEQCSHYAPLRDRCPQIDTYAEECAKPLAERSNGEPSDLLCKTLPVMKQVCAPALGYLKDICEPLYVARQSCTAENLSSPSCKQHADLLDERIPFMLYDKNWGPAERLLLTQQQKYEKFLAQHHADPTQKNFRSFTTGSVLALYTRQSWQRLMKLIPNHPILLKGITFSKKKKLHLSIKHVVGLSVLGGGSAALPGGDDHLTYLQSYPGNTPMGLCMQKLIWGQTPTPPFQVDQDKPFTDLIPLDVALPIAAGMGTNMTVAMVTQNTHPVVGMASLLVIPFFSSLISSRPPKDKALKELMNNFDKLLTPAEEGQDKATTKVGDITEILPILGRSMLFTGKANTKQIDQFCVPHFQEGSWQSLCRPIWQGEEGNLNELLEITSPADMEESVSCDQVLLGLPPGMKLPKRASQE